MCAKRRVFYNNVSYLRNLSWFVKHISVFYDDPDLSLTLLSLPLVVITKLKNNSLGE